MTRVVPALLAAGAILGAAVTGGEEAGVERLLGGSSFSLGFGVTPLRPALVPPVTAGVETAERERPRDPVPPSFVLRLTWPDAAAALAPYLAVGPALSVVEPDYVGRLLGTRGEPTLRLGA